MTKEEAKHYLRELDFDDWFMAGVMFPPKTIAKKRMRKLEDLVILMEPNEKMFPSVKLESVIEWIEEKIEDKELADELKYINQKNELSYLQKCISFHEKIENRCKLLKEIGESDA